MNLVKLTDVCDFQGGTQPPKSDWIKDPKEGFIRMLQIRDFTQPEKNNIEYIKSKSTVKTCIENDVLIGRYGASIGKICTGLSGAYNVALIKTIPNTGILDRNFLLYILKGYDFQNFISNIGSRAAQAGFNKTDLENFIFPLPPLPQQQKIANILDAADALRQNNKALSAKYDELKSALFLDMFGDPVSNPKGWEKVKLKHFGKISTGNTPSRASEENYSSRFIEWIKTDNIKENYLYITEASEYLSEVGIKKARTVEKDAVLVACIAGSIDSIGRAALTDRKVSFNQQINAIESNSKVKPKYLYYLIRNCKKHIQNHASNGMKRMLTKGEFEKILMILPPLSLQNQFSERVALIEEQKAIAQKSLEKSEELFNSLLQKAFKGELI
jgi:type I restriction enzyme S subunit